MSERAEEALSTEDLTEQLGVPLPAREALSLLSPDSSLLGAYPMDGTDVTTGGWAGADQSGTEAAQDAGGSASDLADVSGRQSGEASVTDADRSEQFTSSDSAYAGP